MGSQRSSFNCTFEWNVTDAVVERFASGSIPASNWVEFECTLIGNPEAASIGKGDKTTLKSPNMVKESIPGWNTPAQIPLEMIYDETNYGLFEAKYKGNPWSRRFWARISRPARTDLGTPETAGPKTVFLAAIADLSGPDMSRDNDDPQMFRLVLERLSDNVLVAPTTA